MKMRAAVLYEPRTPFRVEEVELDPPQVDEVLVKLVATGVCHSDVHYYTGDSPLHASGNPIILGHEGAGIVQEVGEGVTHLQPGDHVVLTFLPSCGKCKWCHIGQPTLCDYGAQLRTGMMLDGTHRHHRASDGKPIDNFLFVSSFGEYTVAPVASLVKVPDYLPLERLCLLGCGFTTGFGAATNAVHIRPGESATIIGCGGLGLSAIQGARASGAGKIIAVDVHEEKLEMAKKFGATHTILNRRNVDEVVKEVMEITWGEGSDFSFEFVGWDQSPHTLDIAFQSVRKGGTMVMVGVASQHLESKMPIIPRDVVNLRKKIKGVLFGDAQFQVDIPRYVTLYEQKQIDLDGLVSAEFTLDDINTCVENVLAGNKVARQVIRYD